MIRNHFPRSESSFFLFGKNRVIQLALGRTSGIISAQLVGKTGLLITNRSKEEVLQYFNQLEIDDFARAGLRFQQTIQIDQTPLDGSQHTMEPLLRSPGLSTTLKKGIIHLLLPFIICSKGEILSPEQAKLLKLSISIDQISHQSQSTLE